MSYNKITLIGNLGKDPELRYTPQGMAVCNFSMAVSEKFKNSSGEQQERTLWFKVTVWGKSGEAAAKYLEKGRPVYVEGRLRVEEYTDREGKNRYSIEVNASEVQYLGAKNDDSSRDRAHHDQRRQEKNSDEDELKLDGDDGDDDIPF